MNNTASHEAQFFIQGKLKTFCKNRTDEPDEIVVELQEVGKENNQFSVIFKPYGNLFLSDCYNDFDSQEQQSLVGQIIAFFESINSPLVFSQKKRKKAF